MGHLVTLSSLHHWVCKKCFADFNDEFHFSQIAETNPPELQELRAQYNIPDAFSPGRKLGRPTLKPSA